MTGWLGRVVFAARWAMAPIYLGLAAALVLLAVKVVQRLVTLGMGIAHMDGAETVLSVLRLVDLALVANLVLIVLLAGWDNIIGALPAERRDFADLGFGAVKLRLIASIVAIAAIQVLESFVHIDQASSGLIRWQLAVMLGVAAAGVLLALMDRLSGGH